jgi:predicted nucleic acid-binding Zn ribbon protein
MTYVYQCDQCKVTAERVRSVADRDLPVECGCGRPMRRRYMAPRIVANQMIYHDDWRPRGSREDQLREMREADKRYESYFEGENTVLQEIQTPEQAAEADARYAYEAARL